MLATGAPPGLQRPELYGLGPDALEEGTQLIPYQEHWLEANTAAAFANMARAAEDAGLALAICSGYRSFERQLQIWNAKATGRRPLLDALSRPVNPEGLSHARLVELILLWSALPGASRHHWGTDIDLFDANAISRQALRLSSDEYLPQGPCGPLHAWLQANAGRFGFYFPYQAGLSGVSPEPWHLSYFPVASGWLADYDPKALYLILERAELALKPQVLARLHDLVDEYVFRIAPAPTAMP
ncbi:M15 family metallopeptidase [Shewanella salipaludis]|uniref:M15 family metallopeptidase n=1 Tax=Shewanella salipaludis TaxID=2723052 RepID=UPI003CC7E254